MNKDIDKKIVIKEINDTLDWIEKNFNAIEVEAQLIHLSNKTGARLHYIRRLFKNKVKERENMKIIELLTVVRK